MNLSTGRQLYCNTSPAELIEYAVRQGEGSLLANGALAVRTGKFTGRSPRDKYFVDEPGASDHIHWGPVNQKLSEESFDRLLETVRTHLATRDLFQATLAAGADERYRVGVRVVSEYAWHSLFARQLLVRPDAAGSSRIASVEEALAPDAAEPADSRSFTVLVAPSCFAHPALHGTRSETFIVIHMGRRIVLIGGTEYAGEIKKCVFTLMNYLLPLQGVLSMHCSANVSRSSGETSLFFGLSGTGKTTLSANPDRDLIGDDEHGWSDSGVFNIEGGCYAKCI
ncbi:MAG: phosphoenolpyruvate carboxykinase (ATP), partial [Armatimonadetes bacterium]|nr:phosphoenolpyruvate carboxykinase (ATP) [Armatimonadota bacterium]